MNIATLLHMQPEVMLACFTIILLFADLAIRQPNHRILQLITIGLLLVHLATNLTLSEETLFGGMYHSSPMSSAVKSILTIGTLLVVLQAGPWIRLSDNNHKAGEFYILVFTTLLGMFFMTSAGHFLMFYVGLEMASIPMACLIAFDKYRAGSAEAGMKFILSAMFSSALMLFGISLLYGTVGTLYFSDMPEHIVGSPLQMGALVFFFAGLGFKLSLVPFHAWTPDTYQGAPTTVGGYLSVVSKGAAAFALVNILLRVFGPMAENWELLLSVVIVLTITVGNLMALHQQNMKRFMAYSSISQAGYILLAILAGATGTAALTYYILAYMAANLAVFCVINEIEQHTGGHVDRDDYRALYTTNPRLTLVLTLALFSLAGIPPFAGFFSKFFVFAAAAREGHWIVTFLALINTVISLYYYLLVVRAMYIDPSDNPAPTFRTGRLGQLTLVVCLIAIVALGLVSPIYETLCQAAMLTFGAN